MSAPMEMVANTIPLPVKTPRRRRGSGVKDRDTSYVPADEMMDAAAVRTHKVTMAAERLASDPDPRAEDAREHVDVFV
ncbi:MAG: hypothetical protein JW849_08745 [Phycisphaerae bacterium]|nr:hypothetical protein [Phycisphaerae bacterium]